MTIAMGMNAQLLLKKETTYGTQATGDYNRVPFLSYSLGSEQALVDDSVLGFGSDPLPAGRGMIDVNGDIVVPLDTRSIGLWLAGIFGPPESSDETTHWEHIFTSGAEDIPSHTLELGLKDKNVFVRHLGVKFGSFQLNFEPSGNASATINAVGQSETKSGSSVDATPVAQSYERLSQFQGSVSRDGTPLGNVSAASVNFSNDLEPQTVLRGDGKINSVQPRMRSISGNIETRFDNSDLYDLAVNGTPVALSFAYTVSATHKLVVDIPFVQLVKSKLTLEGPGGIQYRCDLRGSRPIGSEDPMITVTLLNDVEDTVYA